MSAAFNDFIERVRLKFATKSPTRSELEAIGRELKAICLEAAFDKNVYRAASPREELMYELSVDPNGGASIYLVSDGAGVDTPPHEHQIWAVVVGMKGVEFNEFYKPVGNRAGDVIKVSECRIGPGDVLTTEAHEIHAINSSHGIHPTYHIHLYGRSLASLPSFDSRCYNLSPIHNSR